MQSRSVELLKDELNSTQKQARLLSAQARSDATARAEQLAKQLAEEQTTQSQMLNREIAGVKAAANTANASLNSQISAERDLTDWGTDAGTSSQAFCVILEIFRTGKRGII